MRHYAGTGTLLRLILRRDRIRLPVWLLAILGLVLLSARAVSTTYVTPTEIAAYEETLGSSPAAIAMSGPPVALGTIGGILVYETSLTALVGAALMSVFLVVRHTRVDEEEGRTELLRSTVLGTYAPAAAGLVELLFANAVLAVGVSGSMVAVDAPTGGSVVYGAAVGAFGMVFAAAATLAAQVMEHSRGAVGVSVAALGVAFVLRAVGDVGSGRLSWLSPMGWSQQVRAFAENHWWPLLLSLGLSVVLLGAAAFVAHHRDLGAGVLVARPGPAEAAPSLGGPVGLAVRLQRASFLGWIAGVFLFAVGFGSLTREVQELVNSNPTFEQYFAQGGGSLVDSFLATSLLILSLVVSGFAVSSMLRTRSEEAAGRLEPLLATGLSRRRWLLSGVLVTLVGTVLVQLAAGLGMGISYAWVTDDPSAAPRLALQSLAYLPAVLLLAAVTVLLFGLVPRYALLAWAGVAFCFVIGWLGSLLDPPRWVTDISPFTHIAQVPAEAMTATPVVVLLAVAGLTLVLGSVAFDRRDIG